MTAVRARYWAQGKFKIDNGKIALMEIVKYGSKIFTEPDVMRKTNSDGRIYTAALDVILQAMKGHRIFDRFGFSLPSTGKSEPHTLFSPDAIRWVYRLKNCDWVDPFTGDQLTNWYPDSKLRDTLKTKIDVVKR